MDYTTPPEMMEFAVRGKLYILQDAVWAMVRGVIMHLDFVHEHVVETSAAAHAAADDDDDDE